MVVVVVDVVVVAAAVVVVAVIVVVTVSTSRLLVNTVLPLAWGVGGGSEVGVRDRGLG